MPKTSDAPIMINAYISIPKFTKCICFAPKQKIELRLIKKSRHFGQDFLYLITVVKLETYLLFVPEII